jgi:hypothetical protein
MFGHVVIYLTKIITSFAAGRLVAVDQFPAIVGLSSRKMNLDAYQENALLCQSITTTWMVTTSPPTAADKKSVSSSLTQHSTPMHQYGISCQGAYVPCLQHRTGTVT